MKMLNTIMANKNMKVAGVVIMGGLNTRMNYNKKAFLVYKEKTFFEYITSALENLEKIYLSVENIKNYENLDLKYEMIEDIYKEIGPLGGLHSVITKGACDAYLILPSDTPFVTKELVKELLDLFYATNKNVVLRENGKLHPLIAVYKKECIEIINKNIKSKDFKVLNIFKDIEYDVLDFENLNFHKQVIEDFNDLKKYEKLIKGK